MKADGIWANGLEEHLKEIDKEENKILKPLKAALDKNKKERQEIEHQISEIKTQFKQKRKNARELLFVR